ncbi:hypothetical protein WICPIJ_000355 [Wickerhamomyces pijperi]|uniref:Uncharacterized protein n=1 Tax=Wickerhamomyces pijperi TaxID=599730 RepID=A0A9P8QH01_WICPI|nr:hypothetical protein WICPIJ_000355 [Wickerhamomyces pijperi]
MIPNGLESVDHVPRAGGLAVTEEEDKIVPQVRVVIRIVLLLVNGRRCGVGAVLVLVVVQECRVVEEGHLELVLVKVVFVVFVVISSILTNPESGAMDCLLGGITSSIMAKSGIISTSSSPRSSSSSWLAAAVFVNGELPICISLSLSLKSKVNCRSVAGRWSLDPAVVACLVGFCGEMINGVSSTADNSESESESSSLFFVEAFFFPTLLTGAFFPNGLAERKCCCCCSLAFLSLLSLTKSTPSSSEELDPSSSSSESSSSSSSLEVLTTWAA